MQAKLNLRASSPASSPVESQPEPATDAFVQEPEPEPNSPLAAPDPEIEALAERNQVLKARLSEAVTVANLVHEALQRERKEGDKDVKQLKYHLFLERARYDQLSANPRGLKSMPTPAEVQARMAKEEAERRQKEHRRQDQFERDRRKELAEKIQKQNAKRQFEKKEALWRLAHLPVFGPTTKSDHDREIAIRLAAKAIAQSQGRVKFTLGDLREAAGLPRQICASHPRTSTAT